MILGGDIGGTNTRLAFFTAEEGRLEAAAEATYPSRNYSGLDEIVTEFVRTQHFPVTRAALVLPDP